MQSVKMADNALELSQAVSDHWYVSNGVASVGPVPLELIARGVEAGKVPIESFVRNETWKVWRPLAEIVLAEEDRDSIVPTAPAGGLPPIAPPSQDELQSSLRGDDMSADEAIAGATDAKEAMLLLMVAVVREIEADAALVHEVREGGAVVVCAHGGDLFEGLGERVAADDPGLVAANAGHVVVAEPVAGPLGAVLRSRLGRGSQVLEGAALFPLRSGETLLGTLEVGRRTRFRAHELARVEVLVDAVVARLAGVAAAPDVASS